MLASVSPENMIEMARERWDGGTSVVATTAPMPKNVPWQSAVSSRAASSREYLGAIAQSRLPIVKMPTSPSNADFRGKARQQHGHRGAAEGHAERIAADQQPGRRDADPADRRRPAATAP